MVEFDLRNNKISPDFITNIQKSIPPVSFPGSVFFFVENNYVNMKLRRAKAEKFQRKGTEEKRMNVELKNVVPIVFRMKKVVPMGLSFSHYIYELSRQETEYDYRYFFSLPPQPILCLIFILYPEIA